MTPIAELLATKRVIVCCGAGGVGKTTVSASLALAAARAGRRVLVVTIDPSKRLAEALGVDRNPAAPVRLTDERMRAVGIEPPGELSAWMLDPQRVSDSVVQRFSKSDEDRKNLLENRIYKNVTAMVAGMQEYTAVEALHDFVQDDTYDLVVLDTPPSRNALRFLDAPDRVTAFLDKRIFNLFVPGEGSMIRRMATNLLEKVMDLGFGAETRADLQQFFILFGSLLGHLNHNQAKMRAFFQQDLAGFVLVTSPDQEAVDEAFYFERKTRDELGLPLSGYVLNRSLAALSGRELPPTDRDGVLGTALEKLLPYAEIERTLVDSHAALAQMLQARVQDGFAWTLPRLPEGANDLEALDALAIALVTEED